jgi:hypothetical protein
MLLNNLLTKRNGTTKSRTAKIGKIIWKKTSLQKMAWQKHGKKWH